MHDYHLEMSNRFFHILNILFCHFRYVKSHDHEPILSSEYDFVKRPMFLVTCNATPALLLQRWNIKTILFRQFFWGWGWRASMGCFTEISFTALTLRRGTVYPQPVLGRGVSSEKYLSLRTWQIMYECNKWRFIGQIEINWLTISIWTRENLCPSIAMMPCQKKLKPEWEWDVQSMSSPDGQNAFRRPTDGVFTGISSRLNALINFN